MQPRQLIGIALVFVLQNALCLSIARAADEGADDPSCQNQLSQPEFSESLKNVQENNSPIHLIGVAEIEGTRAIRWHRDDSGRMILGTVGEDDKVVAVDPDAEDHPRPIELSPESLLDLGNSIRVRIMPVGSVNPGGDETAMNGPIEEIKTHFTDDGRKLLAVVAASRLVVVDVNADSSVPIFERSLGSDADVQWQTDDAGQSVLIYRDGDKMFITYPESNRADFVHQVPADSTVQTLRVSNGEILVMIKSPTYSDQVFAYSREHLSHRATMTSESMMGLVEGADGEVYLAYTRNGTLVVSKLSDMYTPVLTVPLADGETISRFAAVQASGGRSLAALASSGRIYFLELIK